MQTVKSWLGFLLHWLAFFLLLAVILLLAFVLGQEVVKPYNTAAAWGWLLLGSWLLVRYRARAGIICLCLFGAVLALLVLFFGGGWLLSKLGGWGLFAVAVVLLLIIASFPQAPPALTTLGSAAFNLGTGWEQEAAFNGYNLFFGRNQQKPERWDGGLTTKHLLTVAPTRSGKGSCLIIPNLLFWRGSAVVIDPKGENAHATAARRRAMGQKTIILDPWGEVNRRYGQKSGQLEKVATFDPLSILDLSSPNYEDDVAYIADALIINQGKDPHWDDSARELCAGLIDYALRKYGRSAGLAAVRLFITKDSKEIAGIATDAQQFGPFSLSAKKLSRFKIDSKETASIISTAATQTAFLDNTTLAENLATSSFSFSDLVNGKATLYLVLPVDKLHTYGRWLRLMVSIGIRTLAKNTKTMPAPVLFLLDEFGTIGRLSAVSQAVGLMAGLQMCLWVFVQDLSQLKRDYPAEWETFVANAGNVTFFNVMDQFTSDYLSKMLGQTTVTHESERMKDFKNRQAQGKLKEGEVAPQDQIFARQLMLPDEIRRLDANQGVCIDANGPRKFNKAYYFKDEALAGLARSNPYY